MVAGSEDDGTHFAVVNLAREQGLLSVLPLSLYMSCCYSDGPNAIATGTPRGDGTTMMLLPDDRLKCLGAWNRLGIAQSKTTLGWIILPTATYSTCTKPRQCAKLRMDVMRNVFYPFVIFAGLYTWSEFQVRWVYSDRGSPQNWYMCDSCNVVAEQLHENGRSNFWEELPSIFGLPEWDELGKGQEEFE